MSSDSETQSLLRAELENALARRISRNPHYSLRSLAESLKVSHSLLSLVLSGKRKVSKKLRMKLQESAILRESLERPLRTHLREQEHHQISVDTFAVLSDWYHYAILSLLELPGASSDPKWLAKKLRITPTEARLAFSRLRRLGLLGLSRGKWKQISRPLKVENRSSTIATRKFHHQLLQKAEESLERDPFELRDFSSMTLKMDPRYVEHARQKIRDFRRRLAQELEQLGKPSAVYHLTVQIYPVSEIDEKSAHGEERK